MAGTLTIGDTLQRLVGTGIVFAPPKTPTSNRAIQQELRFCRVYLIAVACAIRTRGGFTCNRNSR